MKPVAGVLDGPNGPIFDVIGWLLEELEKLERHVESVQHRAE
jgi:hypothetical protein